MSIRTLLVDDHRMIRDGLRALLGNDSDVSVVAEAEQGREAVRLCDELKPDVVVMDIAMPDLNGVDATRQIKAKRPKTKVIVLSAHIDQRTAAGALAAGASAIVPKDSAFEELTVAVRAAVADNIYISPKIAGGVVGHLIQDPTASPDRSGRDTSSVFRSISPREREVLQLMSEGHTTKEIAYKLDVSVKTVETHRRQLMEKLNMYSVAELTKYAVREGLTQL